jgi:hypothetical protein
MKTLTNLRLPIRNNFHTPLLLTGAGSLQRVIGRARGAGAKFPTSSIDYESLTKNRTVRQIFLQQTDPLCGDGAAFNVQAFQI